MRWFKHMTCSMRDPKMVQLIAKHGMAGYGSYWAIFEIVAEQVDEKSVTEVAYPSSHWAKMLGTYRVSQALSLLRSLADLCLISFHEDGNLFRVGIPNILKYRDEWTRKKSKTPELIRSDSGAKNRIEENKEYKSPTYSPSPLKNAAAPRGAERASEPEFYLTKRKRKLSGKRLVAFEQFWKAFGYAKGKSAAADAWLDIPELTDSLVTQIIAAAEREALARPGLVSSGRTPKMAQGWITERRWEDGPDILPMTRDGPPGDIQPRTYAQAQDAEQRMIVRQIRPREEYLDANARGDSTGANAGRPALPGAQGR